jgi:hypothetical protein
MGRPPDSFRPTSNSVANVGRVTRVKDDSKQIETAPSPSLSLQYKAFSFRPLPFALRSSASANSTHNRSPTMAQTVRYYWGTYKGVFGFNLNWGSINWDSVVLITACQYAVQDPPTDDYRVNGPPSITVQNIAPHGPPYDPNHGVSFFLNIDSSSPIPVVTDITLLPPPIYVGYLSTMTPLSSSTTSATQTAPGQVYLVQGQIDDGKEGAVALRAPEQEGQEQEREPEK